MQHIGEPERPPLRTNHRREVLILDRDLSKLEDSFMYLAAAPYKEIRFGHVSTKSKMRKTTEEPGFEGKEVEIVEDAVPTSVDLLHGFSFPFSVLHFRFWVEPLDAKPLSTNSKQLTIVDLRKTTKAVKEVKFDRPIVVGPAFRYRMSYIPNPREFFGQKVRLDYDASTHLTAAHFVVSALADDERAALRDGLVSKSYQPIIHEETKDEGKNSATEAVDKNAPIEDRKPQFTETHHWLPVDIKPTVILHNGSIYDKNVVEIDLEQFVIRQ